VHIHDAQHHGSQRKRYKNKARYFLNTPRITGQAQLAVINRFKYGSIIKKELIKLINSTGKTTGAEIMKEFTLNMTGTNFNETCKALFIIVLITQPM